MLNRVTPSRRKLKRFRQFDLEIEVPTSAIWPAGESTEQGVGNIDLGAALSAL